MTYRISIGKQVLKELEELPAKERPRVVVAIDGLANEPRPSGCKKLKGEREYIWRIRVGNYRILYKIEDEIKVVEIRKIGHQKDIYE